MQDWDKYDDLNENPISLAMSEKDTEYIECPECQILMDPECTVCPECGFEGY